MLSSFLRGSERSQLLAKGLCFMRVMAAVVIVGIPAGGGMDFCVRPVRLG